MQNAVKILGQFTQCAVIVLSLHIHVPACILNELSIKNKALQ